MSKVWFSAMLRFVIAIGSNTTHCCRSVVLFKAEDFSGAKTRAAEIGTSMERSYEGGTGEEVRWIFQAIETLDMLGDEITDGREVYAEPSALAGATSENVAARFDPETANPGQSGV